MNGRPCMVLRSFHQFPSYISLIMFSIPTTPVITFLQKSLLFCHSLQRTDYTTIHIHFLWHKFTSIPQFDPFHCRHYVCLKGDGNSIKEQRFDSPLSRTHSIIIQKDITFQTHSIFNEIGFFVSSASTMQSPWKSTSKLYQQSMASNHRQKME